MTDIKPKKSEEIAAAAQQLFLNVGKNLHMQRMLQKEAHKLNAELDDLEIKHQEAIAEEKAATDAQDAADAAQNQAATDPATGADAPVQADPSASGAQ